MLISAVDLLRMTRGLVQARFVEAGTSAGAKKGWETRKRGGQIRPGPEPGGLPRSGSDAARIANTDRGKKREPWSAERSAQRQRAEDAAERARGIAQGITGPQQDQKAAASMRSVLRGIEDPEYRAMVAKDRRKKPKPLSRAERAQDKAEGASSAARDAVLAKYPPAKGQNRLSPEVMAKVERAGERAFAQSLAASGYRWGKGEVKPRRKTGAARPR